MIPSTKLYAAAVEVSAEITRINSAAGETIFNPTATTMLRSAIDEHETYRPAYILDEDARDTDDIIVIYSSVEIASFPANHPAMDRDEQWDIANRIVDALNASHQPRT